MIFLWSNVFWHYLYLLSERLQRPLSNQQQQLTELINCGFICLAYCLNAIILSNR